LFHRSSSQTLRGHFLGGASNLRCSGWNCRSSRCCRLYLINDHPDELRDFLRGVDDRLNGVSRFANGTIALRADTVLPSVTNASAMKFFMVCLSLCCRCRRQHAANHEKGFTTSGRSGGVSATQHAGKSERWTGNGRNKTRKSPRTASSGKKGERRASLHKQQKPRHEERNRN